MGPFSAPPAGPQRPSRRAGWAARVRTAAGESVTVYVSATYAPEQVVPQQWAEFFAGSPHGSELAGVVVRVATPSEVAGLCGADALGCYDGRELVMPGEPFGGVAPEHVARHEYGHHVAANRSNPPWRAADWGPKRWATAAGICGARSSARRIPATTARTTGSIRVRRSPSPTASWRSGTPVPRSPRGGSSTEASIPTQAALRAVEQDVATPWTRSITTRTSARFRPGGPRRRLVPVATPLDGELTAELKLPAGGSTRSSSSAPTGACSRAVSGRGRARAD